MASLRLAHIALAIACGVCNAAPKALRSHRHHREIDPRIMAYFQASNQDFDFWSQEWSVTKTQLVEISYLDGLDPVKKGSTSKPLLGGKATPSKDDASRAAAKKLMANSTAMILVLGNAIEFSKTRIQRLNAQEQKSKVRFADQESQHTVQLASIEKRFQNGTLQASFHESELKAEATEWNRWLQSRDQQKSKLQVALKIQQGTDKHLTGLISAYEQTGAARAPTLQSAEKDMAQFLHEAWADLQEQTTSAVNIV